MGKSKEEILKGYLWALTKMRPTLQTLVRAVGKSQKGLAGLQFRPQKEPNLLEVMEWAATFERAQEIYAASIFLVLDQWVKALSKSLGLKKDDRSHGERIGKGKAPLAALIWATANNFRHHGDWDKPGKLAMVSINILDAAGIHNVRDWIVAPYVLQILKVCTYKDLETKLHHLGKDMLARAPKRPLDRLSL